MSLGNFFNILAVRMQNIEYNHNRSISKAIVEIISTDKARFLYKGLILSNVGFSILLLGQKKTQDVILFNNRSCYQTFAMAASTFLGFTLLAHPFFVISINVQASMQHKHGMHHLNSINCYKNIRKTYGYKGFFRGYVPTLLIYSALSIPTLKDDFKYLISRFKHQ